MRPDTFVRTFWNSLTNPKYYIDVLNVSLWFSVRFMVMGFLFLTGVASLLFTIIDLPKIKTSLDVFIEKTVQEFPEDRSFSWNGLRLSSNQPETYTLSFPKFPDAGETPQYLLQVNPAVDTKEKIGEHSQGTSLFFIGQNAVYLTQPSGGWSDLPLTDVLTSEQFTIDKQSVLQSKPQLLQSLQQFLKYVPFLFAAFFLVISFPLQLLNVLLDTIFIFLVVKLFGMPLSFKKVIQVSLHIMVIAQLVNILTANVSRGLPMFTIAFWGYTIIVYWQLRHIRAFPIGEVEGQGKE